MAPSSLTDTVSSSAADITGFSADTDKLTDLETYTPVGLFVTVGSYTIDALHTLWDITSAVGSMLVPGALENIQKQAQQIDGLVL